MIEQFAKIWGTEELLVSVGELQILLNLHFHSNPPRLALLTLWLGGLAYWRSILPLSMHSKTHALTSDSVNVSLPFRKEDMGDRDSPWPHVDQSPNRRFKHCVQGIMNLVSAVMEEVSCFAGDTYTHLHLHTHTHSPGTFQSPVWARCPPRQASSQLYPTTHL